MSMKDVEINFINTNIIKLKNIKQIQKRIIDIISGIIGVLLLIPLTMLVATINFINHERGPIFYNQWRIGRNGKLFKIYKFRTMTIGADEVLEKILEENKELKKEWENNRKLKNDPRITKTGKILRNASLDEFPQFINVLKGEMSLVGPRAVVEDEIEKFQIRKNEILSVKPGITGYWAVNGRSSTSYKERVEMECYYVRNMSMKLDFKIICKTIVSVIKKNGAI